MVSFPMGAPQLEDESVCQASKDANKHCYIHKNTNMGYDCAVPKHAILKISQKDPLAEMHDICHENFCKLCQDACTHASVVMRARGCPMQIACACLKGSGAKKTPKMSPKEEGCTM